MRPNWSHVVTGVQLLTLLGFVSSSVDVDVTQNTPSPSDKRLNQVTLLHHDTSHLRKSDKGDCIELKTKRYISDGGCSSAYPVKDIICTDICYRYVLPALPEVTQPTPTFEEWQCKKSETKRRKVKLICRDGSRRFYFVRLVTKCLCEKKELRPRDKNFKLKQLMVRTIQKRIKLS